MPRRDDLESICVIGSGPIVIGQACEFDYSGVQALKVLREEGYRTIAGRPMSARCPSASSSDVAIPLRGIRRPAASIVARKRSRSSARSIAS